MVVIIQFTRELPQVITQREHPLIQLASEYHGVSIEVENSGLQAFKDRVECKSGVGCGKGRNYDIGLVRGSNEVVSSCVVHFHTCLLYTSPSPRDLSTSRMPSSA